MERQRALADSALAGAHGHEMAHPCEPVGDAGALLGNLLEDSGPSVADDVVVALHLADVPRVIAYNVARRPRRGERQGMRRASGSCRAGTRLTPGVRARILAVLPPGSDYVIAATVSSRHTGRLPGFIRRLT